MAIFYVDSGSFGNVSVTNLTATTSSVLYYTSSQLNISNNLITVNTLPPLTRFGGLAVIDSGSSPQRSGSILFDSTNNQWIFVHQNTSGAVTSSVFVQTPQTFNNVGNETTLSTNRVVKAYGGDLGEHIGDSNITDTGTIIQLGSATQVTGSLNVSAGITGSLFGTSSWAQSASVAISSSFATTASYALNGGAGGTPLATLVQSTPSSTWTFTHGLGVSNPIVTVYDSSNKVIIPQEVSASNSNTLIITFPTTVAGTVVAAGGTFVGATPQNAVTASYVLNAVSASYVLNAISSSYAATASLAPNYVLNSATSSFILNSQTASFVTNSQTSSFVTTSQTSSFITNSQTSSFVTTSQTSSFATTGSNTFNGDQTINGDLIFSPPASGFNGEIVKFGAGTLTTGQVYFLSSSGTWSLADASSVSSSIGMLGIAVGSSPTSNGLLIRGYAASSSYTQSTGSVLYVNTTAGGITETAPSTTNQVVRVVGYKTTISNTIYFMPDATWVTLA